MKFNIPKKFKVGSVDYEVKRVEHCGITMISDSGDHRE